MPTTVNARRFISLKWRAVVLTSAVLLGFATLFSLTSYHNVRNQFETRRATLHDWYLRQVQGVLDQSAKRLRQWSVTAASLPELQLALTRHNPADLAALDSVLASLGLDLGLDVAAVFNADGVRSAGHGLNLDERRNQQITQAVQRAIAKESPVAFHQCAETCVQYAVAPILSDQHIAGALLLGASPADAILEFQGISGIDIGMLVLSDSNGADPQLWLPSWRAEVVALSNKVRNLALLRQVAQQHPDLHALGDSVALRFRERDYEVRLASLHPLEADTQAYLVLIEDIGQELQSLNATLRESAMLSGLGWSLAEIFLLVVLWAPLSRLRQLAAALPLLGESAYEEVRTLIRKERRFNWSSDEVDVISDTAITLSNRLEVLNRQLHETHQTLAERMQELEQEKSFITHLIDASPALILTLDADGRIVMCNRQGEQLSGYSAAELQGLSLGQLMSPEASSARALDQFTEWLRGKHGDLEQEWSLRRKDGATVHVMWQHTCLTATPANQSAIALAIGLDITVRRRIELRLAWLADHDSLTRLFNRRRFQDELREMIALGKRYQYEGALLFIDLDHFKDINDTAGHQIGDSLLEQAAEELSRLLREGDVIGRVGGDEFAIILPRAGLTDAELVVKKLLERLQTREFWVGGRVFKLFASIGVSVFPKDGDTVEALMAHADIAMYQAKESGRGGWHAFSSADNSHRLLQERMLWKDKLERALTRRQFVLYVQPIVDLQTPQAPVHHYEVLPRLVDEDGRMIAPSTFIAMAERTGLIHHLDRLVLSESLRYLAKLKQRGIHTSFSINLSAHAFSDTAASLSKHLHTLLLETGVDPEQVILELTETAALADLEAAKASLEAVKRLGCRLALDDFGSGYSSFVYLKELPMDFVKIDGAFIRHLTERPDDQALVIAMNQIVQAFGKQTIAEQVESADVLGLLSGYRVNYAQGYYTGRPAPADAVFSDLATH